MCIHSNLHIHVYARMWFEKDPACTILGFRREGGRETQNSVIGGGKVTKSLHLVKAV